ncbi:Heterokaryon incompatibility protein (HET) domain containing protein [Elaphomyces granulatus]
MTSPPEQRDDLFISNALETLLSDSFREAVDGFGKGTPERAECLFRAGKLFALHWQMTRIPESLDSLNHAISFTREALNELLKSHEKAPFYAGHLVSLWEKRVEAAPGINVIDQYMEGIREKIEITKSGPLYEWAIQELGWTYYSRFEHSEDDKDLDTAIESLEEYVNTHANVLPQTNIGLSLALYHRYQRSKSLEDLDRSIDLLEKELQKPQPDHPKIQILLVTLVKICLTRLENGGNEATLDRMISNAENAVSKLPESPDKTWINDLLGRAYSIQDFLSVGPVLNQILDEVRQPGLSDSDQPKSSEQNTTLLAVYDGLPEGQKWIRLLELLPGNPEEEIICKIHTVSMSENPKYEALSYTWGDPSKPSPISVNGHKCNVAINLFLALRRLRRQKASRMLWVDAVCINQSNVHEKSGQVAMMGEIYEAASEVVAWLGEPTSEPGVASKTTEDPQIVDYEKPTIHWDLEADVQRMMRIITRLPHDDWNIDNWDVNDWDIDDWDVIAALYTLILLARNRHINAVPFFQGKFGIQFERGAHALKDLLGSPYWSRVWIAQEVILARRVRVHYGRHVIPMEVFFDAEHHLRQHFYGCCYEACASILINKWSSRTIAELLPVRGIRQMRLSREGGADISLFSAMMVGIDFRKATDPRDHVYGVLGLVNDKTSHLLVPDYTLPTGEVYVRAAFRIMQDSGSLHLLTYADRQSSIKPLPSWCHDWSSLSPFNPNPYGWDLFSVCGNEKAVIELHDNLDLGVRGFHIDTVAKTAKMRTPESLTRATLAHWMKETYNVAIEHCFQDEAYYGDPSKPTDKAFWRTLIGDTVNCADGSTRRASIEDVETLQAWWVWFVENASPEKKDWAWSQQLRHFKEIFESFMDRTQSRKFFVTTARRMGTGVATVFGEEREVIGGDQIFLLQGCNIPVMLRLLSTVDVKQPHGSLNTSLIDETTGTRRYAFVGTSYVQGIMDGEVCPQQEDFFDIRLGHYPPPSESDSARNKLVRNALRMSLFLGNGDRDSSKWPHAF